MPFFELGFFFEDSWLDRCRAGLTSPKIILRIGSKDTAGRRFERRLCCLQSVFSRKQIKILCDLFYDLPADHLFTVGVRSKHGVVAKIVDVSRNSLGTLEYE